MTSGAGREGIERGPPLRAALDASGVVGTWEWDHARRAVTYDEGAALHLTGDASNAGREIRGADAIVTVHPADRDAMVEETGRSVLTAGLTLSEYRVVLPRVGVRWLLSRGRTYVDEDGQPIRSSGILIDITEMRDGGCSDVTRPGSGPGDLLHEATDLMIAAHKLLADTGTYRLRAALQIVLMELGMLIASRIKSTRARHQ